MNISQWFIFAAGMLYLGVMVASLAERNYSVAGVHFAYALANVFMFHLARTQS